MQLSAEIEVSVKIRASVHNGVFELRNSNSEFLQYHYSQERIEDFKQNGRFSNSDKFNTNTAIRSMASQGNFFLKNITVLNVNFDNEAGRKIDMANKVASSAMKTVTLSTMLISLPVAIMLIKIFQLVDFLVYFSVIIPDNFKVFLDIMSNEFFKSIPNPFKAFVDDDCGEIRPKFEENGMSCQFISNVGSAVFLAFLMMLVKFFLMVMDKAMNPKNRLKGKIGMMFQRWNQKMNWEYYIEMIDMFQLDFYLAIFLQLDSMEIRSNKSLYNLSSGIVFFVVLIFTKIYLFFLSTRVAIIKFDDARNKGYKKHYFDFLFLNRDTDCLTYYSKHQYVLNLIKDFGLASSLVLFSKTPVLQVGTAVLISLVYLIAKVYTRPKIKKGQNFKNITFFSVYLTITLFFMSLVFSEGKIKYESRENFIGIPLIVTVSILILVIYGLAVVRIIDAIKEWCKKRKIKKEEELKAKKLSEKKLTLNQTNNPSGNDSTLN